jgi:uncharacterized membrane protein
MEAESSGEEGPAKAPAIPVLILRWLMWVFFLVASLYSLVWSVSFLFLTIFHGPGRPRYWSHMAGGMMVFAGAVMLFCAIWHWMRVMLREFRERKNRNRVDS